MRIFSKAMFTGLAIAAVSMLPLGQAKAQSVAEPAIVVSIAQISEQMDDIGYMAEASGFGQMSFLIKMQAEQFLKGVDTSKPAGVMMFFEEGAEQPSALGFVPISNMDDVLNTISMQAEIEEGDEFITIIPDSGSEILMKQIGDYAYMSDREAMFEMVPSNPASLLGDLPQKYNFGAKVYAQRIPESLREMAMEMIKEGYADSLAEMGDIPADLQEKNFEMQMETMRKFIAETEELVVGFSADKDGGNLHFDFQITGLEGSQLAAQAAAQKDIKSSRFSGFLMEGAAFTANICTELSEEDMENYKLGLGQLRDAAYKEMNDSDMPEEQLEFVQSIADDFFEVLEDTIQEGRIDMGAVVTTKDKLEFAMGTQVSDARKLEDIVKEVVKMVEDDEEVRENAEFNLNSGKMNGLQLHEIILRTPENEEEMVDVLGEELTVIIAVGRKEIYISGGSNDARGLLEKVISESKGDAGSNVVMQYNLFLEPVLRMAAGIEGEEMMEDMADKLSETGRDRVRISAEMIENGLKGQLEIQDGVLELIGVVAQSMGGMMGGGADF